MSVIERFMHAIWKDKEAARAASEMAPGKRPPVRDNVCQLVRPSARAAQAFRTREGKALEIIDTGDTAA